MQLNRTTDYVVRIVYFLSNEKILYSAHGLQIKQKML